ncbi:MAG TPA: winged helix-turn-helix domain-containing protein [archaeon]|nr:winged helix-turn-helix domain-containing protein [archaeon]
MKVIHLLDKEKKKLYPTHVITDAKTLKIISHPLRLKIMEVLAVTNKYPLEIARELKVHEQLVYYHMRILEKHGIVTREKAKYKGMPELFSLKKVAYTFLPNYVEPMDHDVSIHKYVKIPRLLEGFIKDGAINCKIVTGSATPHGRFKASMRSGHLAGEIAALLGRYGHASERICFQDLDVQNLKDNFIIIGGFIVNTLEDTFNKYSPIRFNESGNKIISTLSNREYTEPENAFICKFPNPFDKSKQVLVLAGIESLATKGAVLTFVKYFDRINSGNKHSKNTIGKVIEAVEKNGDIDDVIFLE